MNTLPHGRKHSSGIPISTPGGRVIARVIIAGDQHVLVRRVGPRELFRDIDGWPLGEHAVGQAARHGVTRLRYLALEGNYEVPFEGFLAQSKRLSFQHETQYVLPRSAWRFIPRPGRVRQISLIPEVVHHE